MRDPRGAVRRLPALRNTGNMISGIIYAYIAEHSRLVKDCLRALKDDKFAGPSQALVGGLNRKIIDAIGWAPDFPLPAPGVRTEVDALFLEAWRHHAQDPDVEITTRWLVLGAPAGIENHDHILDEAWPPKDPEAIASPTMEDTRLPRKYARLDDDVKALFKAMSARVTLRATRTHSG